MTSNNLVLDQAKKAFIDPPKKINSLLKLGISVSRKITGKDLLVPKITRLGT